MLRFAVVHPLTLSLDWYYMSFPKDSTQLKAFVGVLAFVETAQTAMICYDALEGYAINLGSLAAFDDVHLAWMDIPITTSISGCLGLALCLILSTFQSLC